MTVSDAEYLAAVTSPHRTIRAYVVKGTDVDIDAAGHVTSITGVDSTVADGSDFDGLFDGVTSVGGREPLSVVRSVGTILKLRLTFDRPVRCPLTVIATPECAPVTVSTTWSGGSSSVNGGVAGDGTNVATSPMPAENFTSLTTAEVTVRTTGADSVTLTEMIFGDAVPLEGVTRIQWEEEQEDPQDRWTVNELTMHLDVPQADPDPVAKRDVLWLALDVVCPSGSVRSPCGRWIVDEVRREGGRATVTAKDVRILLNTPVDPDVWDGSANIRVAELCAAVGVPYADTYSSAAVVQRSWYEPGIEYAELVWRSMGHDLLMLYVRGDGSLATNRNYRGIPTACPSWETEPLSTTITAGMVMSRISSDWQEEYVDKCTLRWPTGSQTIDYGTGNTYGEIDLPMLTAAYVPRRMQYPRYWMEWIGDPQWAPIDSGFAPWMDIADDVPGVPTDLGPCDRVEHVYDGGYRQRVRFYASRENIPE